MKNRDRHILSGLLCAGVSAIALLGSGMSRPAYGQSAAQLLSPGNLMQVANQRASATSQAAAASLANPAIQAQIALSATNLAKAAQALRNIAAAEATASAASKLTLNNAPLSGSAWNGTALSGLKPVDDTNANLWINAQPLQKNAATATATVTQTASKALLTWQSFDLNKGETLVFDQQGHADWTVLNRIVAGPAHADGSRFIASPSYILGSIKADGAVYVINPNGVIFGPTAQINVHSLVASSLDVGNPTNTVAERNSFFLNQGITDSSLFNSTNDSFSYNQSDTKLEGSVVVETGATITTTLAPRTVSPDAGGFVYLIAPNVKNGGTIVTPAGEALMVAAQQVQLTPNIYAAGSQNAATFRAVGVNFKLNPSNPIEDTPWRTSGTDVISAPGQVTNTGLIDAERGVVILNGDEVTNGASGVIQADTSITRNSQIFLDARLVLTLSGGSSIQVLPDENGETILLSAIQNSSASSPAFVPGSVEMQGNTVDIKSGSLVLAPGGSVSVAGAPSSQIGLTSYPAPLYAFLGFVTGGFTDLSRIYMDSGASIDVSGLDDVTLPMSYNLLPFKPFGNEFADQPLQRDGALRGIQLTVDIRQTGTYNGANWIGTPLADVVKLAGTKAESIDQLLTAGGQVKITAAQADQVILRQGSTINVGGGYVRYEGGFVSTTNLVTAQGQIVNIANADPLQTYVGIAGASTLTHPHWGATTSKTFVDPLISGGQYEPGYIEGRNAGGITIAGGSSITSTGQTVGPDYVLGGSLYAGAVIGERQAALGILSSSAAAKNLANPAFAIPTSGSLSIAGGNNVVLESTVTPLPGNFTVTSPLPTEDVGTTFLPTRSLSQADFGQITLTFPGSVVENAGANLTVASGGAISIAAGSADIEGDLTAHSGTISVQIDSTLPTGEALTLTSPTPPDLFNLVLGPHAVLDTSGLWVNDAGANFETLVGSAFVNGGSISLTTVTTTSGCSTPACAAVAAPGVQPQVDITGNIVLSAGSLLNVSSGGRIGTNGQFQLDSAGRAVGSGGNVTLATYVNPPGNGFNVDSSTQTPTTTLPAATLILGGSDGSAAGNATALDNAIHGYGFAQGGKLAIQVPSIQIGGAASSAPGALNLPAGFFDGNGFGEYDLTSLVGGITVAANTTVILRQQNLVAAPALAGLATGADITAATGVAYLPEFIRAPVNLTLDAVIAPLPVFPYDNPPATSGVLDPTVTLLIDKGAAIDAEPRATINIETTGRPSATEGTNSQVGNIDSQVAVAEILGSIRARGGTISLTGGTYSEFWLGAQSRLDVAGIVLRDTRQLAYRSGVVLPGGTVSISMADSTGSLVGLQGALINVSGTMGTLDIAQSDANGSSGIQFSPTEVWSDAGSIVMSAATLLYDGRFEAQPGAAEANGGSLTISLPTNTGTISVVQRGSAVPAGLAPTTPLGSASGTVLFQADRLQGSGIADLTLSAGQTSGLETPDTVHFARGVTISGLNRLIIDASTIALANIPKSIDTGACSVCLSADYFEWQGSGSSPTVQKGTGILTVDAGAIDLAAGDTGGGAPDATISLSGAAEANFISSGDIRLLQPIANTPVALSPGSLLGGQLVTDGNLTLQAAQVYPATNVDFTLKSAAKDGVITILGNGNAAVAPLSAGGQVTVDAVTINQDGRLVAPLGVIRLGAATAAGLSPNDNSGIFVGTRKVTLGEGSVTSVSLDGMVVPYGETSDFKNWSYDSQTGLPLTAAPAKEITISGSHLDLGIGSTVNLSGGGDLQAMEFVNGTGGTRDVLAEANVYAIIPGYNPGAAPIDYDFAKIQGDVQPLAGSSIYLTASSGLPAGYYTLLPAHYATLPGAYRVQVQGTQDVVASQNTVLPDGTQQVAGYFADPAAGTRSARTTLFDVQSSSVWRQYSEIDQTTGNKYFAALAQSTLDSAARLPIDAGHLVIDGTRTVTLLGQLTAAAAAGGRGSEVDIAGIDIQILTPGAKADAGYVGIDAGQLSALGADSLLIGGVRTDSSNTETITPTADSVEITTDAAAPLVAPEIILVTGTPNTTTDPNAVRGLTIDKGSVISGKGTLAANDPTTFAIADSRNQVAGDSAFLAVSSGAPLTVQRSVATGTAGDITVAGGVAFNGGSLTVDARGNIAIGTGSTYAIGSIAITSTNIDLGQISSVSSGTALSGSVLSELAQAKALTLRSLGAITFVGNVDLALPSTGSTLTLDSGSLVLFGNGSVTLAAGTVDLTNSGAAPSGAAAGGTGSLTVNAGAIVLDTGDKQLSGISSAALNGAQQVTLTGAGSLDAGAAALNVSTPLILVSNGAAQSVATTGAATLSSTSGAGSPTGAAQIGGTFTLTAGSISDSTLIQATAGGVTLEATSGNVTLGSGANILAKGYAQTFYDTVRVAYGGSISLIADNGSIDVASGARLDVSSAAGYAGNAGSIVLSAANGTLSSGGGAFDFSTIAGSVTGDGGGRLVIDTQSLGTATIAIPSIFSDTVDVHVRSGDLQLGANLTAQNVTLTADAGTLTIGQVIDASGAKGGSISLFGGVGVVLTASGQLLATASDASKHGGDVVIGTEVASENGSGADGVISLQGGVIDVSNTADGAMGGTVRLRAPLIGSASDDVSIDTVNAKISGASSVTIEAFKVFDPSNSAFNGIIDPAGQPGFYGSCTAAGVCTGTLVEFVQNFALSATALQKFASISSSVLHAQPGIELVNNDLSVNGGDITVASAWNLGAGVAGNLINLTSFTANGVTVPAGTVVTDQNGQLLPQYAGYTGQLGYETGVSDISKLFYRVGGLPTGESGTLTLRAVRDVNIDAPITDGFFLTQNRLDKTYITNLYAWVQSVGAGSVTTNISNVGGYIITGATAGNPVDSSGNPLGVSGPPMAPYDASANAISPVQSTSDPAPVAGADLFPLIKTPNGPIVGTDGNYRAIESWSYHVVGGADTNSANPLAVASLGKFADNGKGALAGHGNVTINGGGAVRIPNLNSDGLAVALEIPTIVRTGTSSIDIAAGRDFILANTEAPGVVYTAGRSSVALPDPVFKMETVADPLNPGQTTTIPVAANPNGFLSPDLLTCDPGSAFNCNPYGAITEAAYPVNAGHLTITVQQDILGYEHPDVLGSPNRPNQQYFAPWLISQGTSLSNTEFGVFSVLSGYVTTGGNVFTPSQTSWWINFGSFDQGVMSVGGDVRIVAGRDISQLGVSLPTTERTSGGLSNTITNAAGQTVANIPVVNLNPSGDMTVIAGRNIESGAFYEGSGQAKIIAGGDVAANWSAVTNPIRFPGTPAVTVPVSTVLAVDTGQITLSVRGSVDIAGVVSAASMQNVADFTGNTNGTVLSSFLSSYGPNSAVTAQSVSGNVTVNTLINANSPIGPLVLIMSTVRANSLFNSGPLDDSAYRGVSAYPASFEAVSLGGNVTVANALQLAPSDTGTLNLLADGSLMTQSAVDYNSRTNILSYAFQALSTGPSLVEQSFNATEALAGFAPPSGSQVLDLGARLLHQDDNTPDRFYALTGDIISGQGSTSVPANSTAEFPLSWEISKFAQVYAGRDIVDLPFFGQNLDPKDITQIIAGRDIYYTGATNIYFDKITTYSDRPTLLQPENAAGLNLAGPGFFEVEAGRNLGPFVTAAADAATAANTTFATTDATGTGIITFGNNVTVGNRLMTTFNAQISGGIKTDDAFATGTDFLLPRQGANVIALFGVGKGINYQGVIQAYINPATATSAHNYGPDMVAFLQTLGLPAQSAASAWTTFQSLPAKLQNVFVDQVYFNELKLAGLSKNFSAGYKIIDTLFPASYGYTNNGPNGNGPATQVATGDLEMLHATIKTLQATTITVDNTDGSQSSVAVGGNVTIMGPGGNIDVGSQAVEINKFLTASALGILTLDDGIIDSFTDGSLLVNQSRVLTVQGGDITLWSSNGNLDAGKGAKTTVDFKPLTVNFDPSSLQTINLTGLVSGAGIGTIQSTPDAPTASATLLAPRGIVNAGDAGLRSSGNLAIVALRVLNAANISALGAVTGVPQTASVNLGSLESASSTAGAGSQAAQEAVAAAAGRNAQVGVRHMPSLITVEVLGFGDCDPEGGKPCQE